MTPQKPLNAQHKATSLPAHTLPSWPDFFELFRIKQWIKNLFLVAPLAFSGQMLTSNSCIKNLSATLSFCLLSSAVYIFNDIADMEADRTHLQKANRPIAAGRISPCLARKIALTALILGLAGAGMVNLWVLTMGVAYICLNYIYNVHTKKLVFLDVMTISTGFYIRIWAGSLAIGIAPSDWLQACTIVLTLFLGFTKRRHEMSFVSDAASGHRKVLSHYPIALLDKLIVLCSGMAVFFYGLYTFRVHMSAKTHHQLLIFSIFFVIYGILRYLYLIRIKNIGDDPGEIVLTDKPILICILLWIGWVFFVLYGHKLFL